MVKSHPSITPAHPGEILREDVLPALAMSESAIAAALGIPQKTLEDILAERRAVTAETALRLGKLLGNGAQFWTNLQRSHDLAVARRSVDISGIPTLRAHGG